MPDYNADKFLFLLFIERHAGHTQVRKATSGGALSTPTENPTIPPIENPTDRRGDEPQFVAAS